jgi:cyclopropane fatty-acyl-phospholipid synthase-like methyltransferase
MYLKEQKMAWDNVYENGKGSVLPWRNDANHNTWVNICMSMYEELFGSRRIESMLDYGGGDGLNSIEFGQKYNIKNILLADISDKAQDLIQLRQNNIEFLQASKPSDIKRTFDFILCQGVFHHIKPEFQKKFIAEFSKMLNPNGGMILSGWSQKDPAVIHYHKENPYSKMGYYGMMTDAKLFQKNGLQIIATGEYPLEDEGDTIYRRQGFDKRIISAVALRKEQLK